MPTVYIPAPLRRLTAGQGKVAASGSDVREVLDALERQFPGLQREVCDEAGELRAFINVFVNGTEIRQLQGLRTQVAGQDEVSIIPAMAGGGEDRALRTHPLATALALPDLRIVAPDAVSLHEETDPARVERLCARLQQDGVLRNPPIAAALPEGGYVVLDGANRVSALNRLRIPVTPLQVVDYQDASVGLDVWRHFIPDRPDLLSAIRAAGLPVEPVAPEEAARRLRQREIACWILSDGGAAAVPLSPARVLGATLAGVVATYKGTTRIYRVSTDDLTALRGEYGAAGALVIFPHLEKQDILEIAHAPLKLPAGITRHIIPRRALRLNLPLRALRATGDLAQKNRWLAELIRQRLLDHGIRSYPEGVVLFDE